MDRDRDRLRLLLVVALGLSVAAAGCLGGGGGDASDHGAGDGAGDGGGDGGGSGDGGSGDPFGFYDGSTDPVAEAPGTAEYRNATAGFRMLVPDDWQQLSDSPLWYVGPDPGIESPRRNLNVVTGPSKGMGHDEYVETNIDQVRRMMDAEDLRVEAAVLGGDEATRIAFDGTFRGMQLTWIQLVAVHGDRAYTVTYVFPQGEEPGHEAELETALESFAFLEGDASAPSGEPGTEPTAGV